MNNALDGITKIIGDSMGWVTDHPQFLLALLIPIGIYLILFYNR